MLPSKSANKSIRKLERPRPLKWMTEGGNTTMPSPVNEVGDEVVTELENLVKHLTNSNIDNSISGSILKVCRDLKHYGGILESRNTVQLDRYFNVLRNAARDERLETICRLHLLEIIELRASGWKGNENVENFYKNKLFEAETMEMISNVPIPMSPLPTNTNYIIPSHSVTSMTNNSALLPTLMPVPNPPPQVTSVLNHGEVLKSSGKYEKATKITGKNYFKDEIVIHNSDSGKVAQGAKDRLVQITGPTEESIGRARQLVEETIRRNTSPIRERANPLQTSESSSNVRSNIQRTDGDVLGRSALMHSFSMNDASIGEYQYTVNVGRDTLKLSGKRLDVVKSVEDEYFGAYEDDRSPSEPSPELTSIPRDHPSANYQSVVKPGGQWTERNGHRLSKSSRITGRCTSHDSTPELEDLYKKPQVDDEEDDDDDSDDNLEGKIYHTVAAVPALSSFLKNGVRPKYVYTRDFLLECASSTYSHSVPKDLPKIIQEIPTILNKKPEFFDPVAYKKGRTTPPISFGNGGSTGWNHRSGSWGSQDADDEDAHPS